MEGRETVLGRGRFWMRRIAGLAGTAALLGSGVAIAVMVVPSGGDDEVVPAAPAATPEPKERKPSKPKLTTGERRSRRAALATLSEQGYEPVRVADYDPKADLRVLVGRDADGARRAFFFAGRTYLGNDSEFASRRVRVVRSGRRSVTLAYRLYEPADRPCCPRGATAQVRFRWTGETLAPQGELPDPVLRLRIG
jgi:hypothetical protein